MPSPKSTGLTREACRAYLDETTFRLRPKDYEKKYPQWPGAVGLEIEMLPVDLQTGAPGRPGNVKLQGPGRTSARILRDLAQRRGWQTEDTESDTGEPLLLRVDLGGGDNFSFEPGGQVEFSSQPFPCLSEAVRRMRTVQGELDQAYQEEGMAIVQVGINPWHTVPELGLQMGKGRYRAMDRYYAGIGEYGQRMMRQTCTVQVNLDFGPDETTLAKRYLAGQLLAPVAAASFAYSPVVDRRHQGIKGFRSRIWRHTDPTHTGLPGMAELARSPSRAACIDTYLDFVLGATVVFVTELGYKVPGRQVTFGEWLTTPIEGLLPTLADLATHLSLMFPEVRPRGFLELRSVDCQARAFEGVPAAFWTGLLYDTKTLDRLLHLLLPHQQTVPELLVRAESGLDDPRLAKLAKEVMDLALTGFSTLSTCFKADGADRELARFAARFTARGRVPADDLLDRLRVENSPTPTLETYQRLEDEWARAT